MAMISNLWKVVLGRDILQISNVQQKHMPNVLHSWSSSISFPSNLFWERPRPGVTKQDSVRRLVSVCMAHRHTLHLAQWRQHHEPLQSCQRRGQKWFRWKVFSHVAGWWWKGQTQWVCWNQEHVYFFFAGIVFVWFLCGVHLSLVSLNFSPFPKSNLDLIAKYINIQQKINKHFLMVVATSFADFCCCWWWFPQLALSSFFVTFRCLRLRFVLDVFYVRQLTRYFTNSFFFGRHIADPLAFGDVFSLDVYHDLLIPPLIPSRLRMIPLNMQGGHFVGREVHELPTPKGHKNLKPRKASFVYTPWN